MDEYRKFLMNFKYSKISRIEMIKGLTRLLFDSAWKPLGLDGIDCKNSMFIPKNKYEEIVLLLYIGDVMAVSKCIELSKSLLFSKPIFKLERISAYKNLHDVCDLMTILLVRWEQVELLHEPLERALKFSFEGVHILQQRALAHLANNKPFDAINVLSLLIELDSSPVVFDLFAARQCFESLERVSDGLQFSKNALAKEMKNPTYMLSKCYLYVAIGYFISIGSLPVLLKKNVYSKCLENLENAIHQDPHNYLSYYYLALYFAEIENINESLKCIRKCLELRPECINALQLLCLLLSLHGKYTDILTIVEEAIGETFYDLNLLKIYAKTQLKCGKYKDSFRTVKFMFKLWGKMYGIKAGNIEIENDTESKCLKTYIDLLLFLAEIYLITDLTDEALNCIEMICEYFPQSYKMFHMKGLIYKRKKKWNISRMCFENAIGINPKHVESLIELGLYHYRFGSLDLAENFIRISMNYDSDNFDAWYVLFLINEKSGQENITDLLLSKFENMKSKPILPYGAIDYIF